MQHPFSLEAFRDFCRSKGNETYNFNDLGYMEGPGCAGVQYMCHLGLAEKGSPGAWDSFIRHIPQNAIHQCSRNWTFSGLADDLDRHLRKVEQQKKELEPA